MDIKVLTKKDIGRWVIYRKGSLLGEEVMGKIKSWNNHFIFVVYKCENKWDDFLNYTGEATSPEDLVWR